MPRLHAFEGATLEEALARVTAEVGHDARITQAEKVRTGGVAGFFARERFEVTVELDDELAPVDQPEPLLAPEPEPAPRSLLDLVAEADDLEQPAAPLPSTEGQAFQDVLRRVAADSGLLTVRTRQEPAPPPRPEPVAPVAAPPAAPEPVAPPVERADDDVTGVLRSLGVPDHLLSAPPAGTSIAQHLLRALEGIPTARPVLARRGEVVVVVGDRDVAIEAAGHLAGQLGLDPDDVVIAAPEGAPIADAADAAQHATVWRTCRDPFVVAVCPPAGATGTRWARKVVDALQPVLVWAAVRADRKAEDVAAGAQALGRVDALAVGGCADTCSPAAVLGTGIPVAVVEGRRSTPAAWTALLAERFVP